MPREREKNSLFSVQFEQEISILVGDVYLHRSFPLALASHRILKDQSKPPFPMPTLIIQPIALVVVGGIAVFIVREHVIL